MGPRTGGSAGKSAKILVIAGPSGAGKSTLFRAFHDGRLPPALAQFLPSAAKAWPVVSANGVARKGLRPEGLGPEGLGPEGLIVHYDIMRVVTRGYDDHRDDPALRAILHAGVPLDIVTLAPAREQLLVQFLKRVRDDAYDEPWERRNLTRRLARWQRRMRERLFRSRRIVLSETHLILLAIYGSERRFFAWSQAWARFVEDLAFARSDVRAVSIVPEPDDNDVPSFRLAPEPARETAWRATA